MTPIQVGDELRAAAKLMRERAEAVDAPAWPGMPWGVTACGDDEAGNCPCIVHQGEYKPYDEPQVPLIQYVADAETTEHATHIASWHPGVAVTVAEWLDCAAALIEATVFPHDDEVIMRYPLAVARAYLRGSADGRPRPSVPGHELREDGKAYGVECGMAYGTGSDTGRALCACGAISGVLFAATARREWHQGHLDEVLRQRGTK